jgi:hypothetical protein
MKCYVTALLATGAMVGWDAAASPSRANDTSVELAVGGLVFTKNAEVSIESEDLVITPDAVTVRYMFLNQSAAPVTLTVAFPLPDIDLADGANVAFPTGDPVNFVGFSTKVDGKPINFTVNQRARSAPGSSGSTNFPSRRAIAPSRQACWCSPAPTTRGSLSMSRPGS